MTYVPSEDSFYVCDAPNHRITKVAVSGEVLGFFAEPGNGTYTIVVHDYSTAGVEVPNATEVEVYVNGTLDETYTELIFGEDCWWTVAVAHVQGNNVSLTAVGDLDCP